MRSCVSHTTEGQFQMLTICSAVIELGAVLWQMQERLNSELKKNKTGAKLVLLNDFLIL